MGIQSDTSKEQDKSSELKLVGDPIKLNTICDPYHRVSLKMQQFMTTIDLIPVDWTLDVKSFFVDDKERKNKKGVVDYSFDAAIDKFKKRCDKYGLTPKSGLRILTSAESTYQEQFGNNYGDNLISTAANNLSSVTGGIREVGRSLGYTPEQATKMMNDKLNNGTMKQTAEQVKLMTDGAGGDLAKNAWNIIMEGRQMSLPKIYKNSSYEPTLQTSIKLISPYGSPDSIRQHVLEPLMYLLLLSSPDTSDGLSYGGHMYLRVKAYGVSDINLGYIESISVSRGGNEHITNKFGQPLSAQVSLVIKPAIPGFACLSGESGLKGMNSRAMLKESITEFKPIENSYGLTTLDNVVSSFKGSPGSKKYTNNGEYPSNDLLSSVGSMVQKGVGAASSLKKSVSGAMSKVMM